MDIRFSKKFLTLGSNISKRFVVDQDSREMGDL